MSYQTEIITDPARFRELRSEWDELLERSGTSTVFQTWEWLSAWWEAFGSPGGLRVVVARDSAGRCVGAAPLHLRRTTYYRFPVRELSFIGEGFNDRQDFVLAPDRDAAVRVLCARVFALEGWDILRLEPLPEGGALLGHPSVHGGEVEECSLSPYLRVQGGWEEYCRGLSKKFRGDIRNKTHRLDKLGAWTVRRVSELRDCPALIEEMRVLEQRSHKPGAGTAFFSRPGALRFMEAFLRLASARGWVEYAAIDLAGTPICYLLGFVRAGTYVAYSMAFSESAAEASPGKLLIHAVIRWHFEHPGRIEEFDLSRGDTYIKSLWCTEARRHWRVVRFRSGLYPAVVRAAVFGLRPRLKRYARSRFDPPDATVHG